MSDIDEPETESETMVYSTIRVSKSLSATNVSAVADGLTASLDKSETTLGTLRAWQLKNDSTAPANIRVPALLSILMGAIIFVVTDVVPLARGTTPTGVFGPLFLRLGVSQATILLAHLVVDLLGAGIVIGVGWYGFWKFITLLPGTVRGDASVGIGIHGTTGRETAITYYGNNLSDHSLRTAIEDLHEEDIQLEAVAETGSMQWHDEKPTEYRVGKLVMNRKIQGDEFTSSLSAKTALDSADGDRNNPSANIIREIADCSVPVHAQLTAAAVIDGETQRARKLRYHEQRQQGEEESTAPEDFTRAEQAREASGNYLTLSVFLIAEVPANDPVADKKATETFNEIKRTIEHVTAAGISVELVTDSTLQNPSGIEKSLIAIGLKDENATIEAIVEAYLDRAFEPNGAITMEAETAALLLSLPGDANEAVNTAIDLIGVHELPETSLTPGAEHEVMSAYDPAPESQDPNSPGDSDTNP